MVPVYCFKCQRAVAEVFNETENTGGLFHSATLTVRQKEPIIDSNTVYCGWGYSELGQRGHVLPIIEGVWRMPRDGLRSASVGNGYRFKFSRYVQHCNTPISNDLMEMQR